MEEMKFAFVVDASGIGTMLEFPEGAVGDKLDWYYETIGCRMIDIVNPYGLEELAKQYGLESIVGKYCIVVDDEGLLKDKPKVNPIASLLYGVDSHGQPLFGDVIILKNELTDEGLDSVGMTLDEVVTLKASINALIERHNEKVRGEANG